MAYYKYLFSLPLISVRSRLAIFYPFRAMVYTKKSLHNILRYQTPNPVFLTILGRGLIIFKVPISPTNNKKKHLRRPHDVAQHLTHKVQTSPSNL
jgi:hypothetical protein